MDIEKNSICGGYEVIRTLGNGYHAKYNYIINYRVKLGKDLNDQRLVALKIFKNTHALA